MSYKETKVLWGGEQFIFVTRGRSKPFTTEEAVKYLTDRTQQVAESSNDVNMVVPDEFLPPSLDLEPEEEPEAVGFIPEDRHRKLMFMRDFRTGVKFCSNKYGKTDDEIIAEVKRLAPHMNV